MDSSTSKKFSRHFIVHLPNGELFEDAPTCGIFVKNFVGRLAEEVATGEMVTKKKRPTLAKYLFVNNKVCEDQNSINITSSRTPDETSSQIEEKKHTCFIDTGVYTRNRLFRILGSVKYGKPSSAALRIASANKFKFPSGFGNDNFYEPCFASNIKKRSRSTLAEHAESVSHGFDHEDEMRQVYSSY